MDNKQDNQEQIKELILKHFHLDKLCPKCQNPMEVENTINCRMCSLKKTLRTQTDMADSAIHSIKTTIGR